MSVLLSAVGLLAPIIAPLRLRKQRSIRERDEVRLVFFLVSEITHARKRVKSSIEFIRDVCYAFLQKPCGTAVAQR